MSKISSKQTWEGRKSIGSVDSIMFSDIFHAYLEKSKGKTCLEIGCVPGGFLSYICKEFEYNAEGIDYVKGAKSIVAETLEANGIKRYEIHEKDFLEWNPRKKYDLVCSFGFIEHFTGKTNDEVIDRHIRILKPGGKLILEVPNFTYIQYIIHFILDRKTLKEHNLKTMKLSYYKKMAKKYNLNVVHLDYNGGFFMFWGKSKDANLFQKSLFKALKWIQRKLKNMKQNNRFLSPYIVFVAEKPNFKN